MCPCAGVTGCTLAAVGLGTLGVLLMFTLGMGLLPLVVVMGTPWVLWFPLGVGLFPLPVELGTPGVLLFPLGAGFAVVAVGGFATETDVPQYITLFE